MCETDWMNIYVTETSGQWTMCVRMCVRQSDDSCICGGMLCWRILLLMLSPGEFLLPGVQWTKRGVCMRICHFPARLSAVTKTDRQIDVHSLGQRCRNISPVAYRFRQMQNKQLASKRSEQKRNYNKTERTKNIKSELGIGQDVQLSPSTFFFHFIILI